MVGDLSLCIIYDCRISFRSGVIRVFFLITMDTQVAEYETEWLARQAAGGAINWAVGQAILAQHAASQAQRQAQDALRRGGGEP